VCSGELMFSIVSADRFALDATILHI
jgi:hypothetical protein